MQQTHEKRGSDELRARFTGWLIRLSRRVRIHFLLEQAARSEVVSLTDLSPELEAPDFQDSMLEDYCGFHFQDEQLAEAFVSLSAEKQQILSMFFVEKMKPREIAAYLGCLPQHVYDQKYHALKKLQADHTKGGDCL